MSPSARLRKRRILSGVLDVLPGHPNEDCETTVNRRTGRAALLPGFWVVSILGVLALSDTPDATPPTAATDLHYSVVDGGAVIEGCGGHDCQEGLIIPSTIDTGSATIPVRASAAEAFVYPNDDDEEPEGVIRGDVVIPDSVTVIGDAAFEDQDQITTVLIGDGVVTIDSDAFEGAHSLTSLTLGRGVATIGADAFYDTGTLASLVIPDSVISVGNAAFRGSGITSLALGSGLESIETYGFANNTIGNLVLPDSLTMLGSYSFANVGVTSIEFGSWLATIGFGASVPIS